jgi:NAD(P)-dependent dehydrogenase (short-subunit alcohol dehydrogenase family)
MGWGRWMGWFTAQGVQIMRPLSMLTAQHLDQTLKLNVNAALGLVKALAVPGQFRKPASCVLLASVMGMVGQPVQSAYSASKGAVIAMTRSLAVELARQQIRVNCIAPSLVAAGMGLAIEKVLTPDQFEKVVQMHPLGLGKGSDIASAAAFLLSDAARWITGTAMVVDGGLYGAIVKWHGSAVRKHEPSNERCYQSRSVSSPGDR